jgi:hypothetical protein
MKTDLYPVRMSMRDPLHGPTEADIVASMRVVKERLADLRGRSRHPVTVQRVRPTRTGWAVIYREGDGQNMAFSVDASCGESRAISLHTAVEQWTQWEVTSAPAHADDCVPELGLLRCMSIAHRYLDARATDTGLPVKSSSVCWTRKGLDIGYLIGNDERAFTVARSGALRELPQGPC